MLHSSKNLLDFGQSNTSALICDSCAAYILRSHAFYIGELPLGFNEAFFECRNFLNDLHFFAVTAEASEMQAFTNREESLADCIR